MSSHFTCCGCWPAFVQGVQGTTKTGRVYRRAKYNEREYSIEFENLIEEEDFYTPSQHAVTEVERDLLSRGKFGELLHHENDITRQQDAKLREKEENARLEDEAYIQAKREASRVAKQSMRKQINDKSKFPNMQTFDSVEFSKWLSEEKIDISSPELDVEDFESFLEKVRAKSAQAIEEAGKRKDANVFEQTLSQGLAATKIAGDALNALQPVELHAVGTSSFNHTSHRSFIHSEHVAFDSNYGKLAHITEESQLMNVPAVEIKSDIPGIQTSHLPGITASQAVHHRIPLHEPKKQLVDISPIANVAVECDTPVLYSSQLAVTSSRSDIPSVSKSQLLDVSDPRNTSEKTATFNSEITEIQNFNSKSIHVQPVTEAYETSLDNSLSATPQFSLNNTLQHQGTGGKLIDISPLKDHTQQLENHVQFTTSSDNQSFDEPSLLNQNNLIGGRLGETGTQQDMNVQPKQALQLIESSTMSSALHVENQPRDSTPVSSEIGPVATVVTINTPRNVATNLKPVESKGVAVDTLPALTNDIEVESFKMVKPAASEMNSEMQEDSLNDDDDFNDFDDDFVSSNSNAIFEDYLT